MALDESERLRLVLLYYRHDYRTERADDTRIYVGPHGVIFPSVVGGGGELVRVDGGDAAPGAVRWSFDAAPSCG